MVKVKTMCVSSDLGTAQHMHVLLVFPPSFFHLCVKLPVELEKEGQLVWEEMVAMGETIFNSSTCVFLLRGAKASMQYNISFYII